MALFKIADFNPNYREEAFDGDDVKGLDVYSARTNDKIGSIDDILVDETGRFRYLVLDTGFWIFGKKVLLPVGRCYVDPNKERIYAKNLFSKDQAEELPEYSEAMTVDYEYEERVRNIYRTPSVENSAPVEMTPPVGASGVSAVSDRLYTSTELSNSAPTPEPIITPTPDSASPGAPKYDRSTYTYDREPEMYQMDEREHQKLKLYEEKLVARKNRQMTGEVTVGKRLETEVATASVPVERERIVIERKTPTSSRIVNPTNTDFQEGEIARMKVYEETADIKKQAFVREEVSIRKEVEKDTVEAQETLRRQELDVNVEGNPVVEQ
ncbi:DUF2382 domain-containing protein [Mastigocoleus testarum]|uniref:Photosystem reaction center subunit H n=1 Tax=Mastigocoleus testarum BC008 TaxID=371196 RepID=A0A0V7ZNF4_9CYAN|nr:DUF2382 domain-containing protein [Mastigocoleus testarum]KST65934.1 photosystem reaction center subunit H [Mastigocoleus testarum BC008]